MSLYDTAKNLVKSAIPRNLTTKESKSSNASTVGTGNSEYDRLVGYYDGPHRNLQRPASKARFENTQILPLKQGLHPNKQ